VVELGFLGRLCARWVVPVLGVGEEPKGGVRPGVRSRALSRAPPTSWPRLGSCLELRVCVRVDAVHQVWDAPGVRSFAPVHRRVRPSPPSAARPEHQRRRRTLTVPEVASSRPPAPRTAEKDHVTGQKGYSRSHRRGRELWTCSFSYSQVTPTAVRRFLNPEAPRLIWSNSNACTRLHESYRPPQSPRREVELLAG
jgi:hypothetical protein